MNHAASVTRAAGPCTPTVHPRIARLRPLLPLAGVIGAAIAVRAAINFATPLMPKVNAAYYLVQVRALLIRGNLAVPDMPLLFTVEAGLAWLLQHMLGLPSDASIMVASKLVDVCLPPLAAIPVYAVARQWNRDATSRVAPGVTAAAFAVLHPSAITMTSDFQKNALGIVWIAATIAALHHATGPHRTGSLLLGLVFLLMAALTHIGAFAVALAYAALYVFAPLALHESARKRVLSFLAAALVSGAALMTLQYAVGDPARTQRLAQLLVRPASLVERPVLFTPRAFDEISVPNLILLHLIAVFAAWALVRDWPRLQHRDRLTVSACLLLTLFLASPFLGQTYASRLHLMAFLPASFVCGFALSRIRSTCRYRLLLGTAWLAVIVPTIVALPKVSQPAISPEACLELRALSVHIPNPDHTLIVARHGLEWWAAWALETKVAQDFAVEPDAWQKYKTVLFLRQSPQTRTGGSGPFPDVVIPQEAEVLHRGLNFSLARVSVCPRNYPRPKPNSARRNQLSLHR